ncbi:hypothetical protein E2562_001317 [Oryza meyeriana var. granulata]|uniref:Uncharacterized protein n=1 Tax=Oryza meyeriana var. granulata TaxID=110450 RepID=A0A6G1DCF2_9ORYZ|nr:hypothetical protein E2562_001317 [Oryza meyeriana var. granulata]
MAPVAMLSSPLIALAAGVAAALAIIWLVRLVSTKRRNAISCPREAEARLPPGSRGLLILGETLEFFTQSPSLDLPAFFIKRRLDRGEEEPVASLQLLAPSMNI